MWQHRFRYSEGSLEVFKAVWRYLKAVWRALEAVWRALKAVWKALKATVRVSEDSLRMCWRSHKGECAPCPKLSCYSTSACRRCKLALQYSKVFQVLPNKSLLSQLYCLCLLQRTEVPPRH
jgi:hypothetical protein